MAESTPPPTTAGRCIVCRRTDARPLRAFQGCPDGMVYIHGHHRIRTVAKVVSDIRFVKKDEPCKPGWYRGVA